MSPINICKWVCHKAEPLEVSGKYKHLSLILRLELFKREKNEVIKMSSYLTELLKKIKKTNKLIKKSIRISNLQHLSQKKGNS